MKNAKLPACHDGKISLHSMVNKVYHDVLLLFWILTIFKTALTASTLVKDIDRQRSMPQFSVNHLNGTFELHSSICNIIMDREKPGVEQEHSPWLLAFFKLVGCLYHGTASERVTTKHKFV